MRTRFLSKRLILLGLGGALVPTAAYAAPPQTGTPPVHAARDWDSQAYRGSVDVVAGPDEDQETIDGTVFLDRNRNSRQDGNEIGLDGVTVSNGRDVVTTDRDGRYELPAFDNMTVFVTQPRGYQVPVDADNVAQFHYHHLPAGSPELRYGGIAPTGPLPDEVNFPLDRNAATQSVRQSCVIGGDIQPYDTDEVEYARNGAFADLAARDDYAGCGVLFIGDVVGDDLSLYPGVRTLTRELNGPARFLPGNHDLDFDAPTSEHAYDTFRAQLSPEYYSYDVGKVHVVAMSNVEYPLASGGGYNGAIDARQMEWLRNDIAQVPEDRLIVLAGHVPLVSFADQASTTHSVDQAPEIYELLAGRDAVVAIGGHTHSIENMREGDLMEGWNELFGIDGLPFHHITAGAISGDWFSGELLPEGYPTALQRDGGLPGVLTLDIRNTSYRESFAVRGEDPSLQMAVGLNTPRYRAWTADPEGELADPLTASTADLAGTTWLTTNFWMGSTGSTVEVSLDGGAPVEAVRTQEMQGEGQLVGAEWSDPVAMQQQLVHGGSEADRTMHLWRLELPADLAVGPHTADVTATDAYGRTFTDSITFEIVAEG